MTTTTHRWLAWDGALLRRLARIESRLFLRAMRLLTRMGDAESWLLGVLILAAGGPDGRRQAALLALAVGLATLLSQALKRLAGRPRPSVGLAEFAARIECPDEFSFPSGHTAAAFAVAAAFLGEPMPLALTAVSLASGIGLSRMALGAHYPLDVAAGALLGAGCGFAARFWLGG